MPTPPSTKEWRPLVIAAIARRRFVQAALITDEGSWAPHNRYARDSRVPHPQTAC